MTNAELLAKIKAEIERQKTENNNIKCKYNEKYCIGYDDAFNDILSFLDTLQEQEPEVDLEEEADRMFFSLGWYEGDHHQPMLDCVSLDQFRGIARHFYDLGLKNAR